MPSRRAVLGSSVALAATLAGCSDLNGDGTDDDGGGTTPTAGVDAAVDWLPAPEGGGDAPTPQFTATDFEQIAALDDRFDGYDPTRMPPVRYDPDPIGVGLADLSYAVHTSWSFRQAVRGEFDRSAVESRLDDAGYERSETTAGFGLYAGDSADVAVGDEHVCWSASNLDDGVDPSLTAAVAAKAGDGARAVDENERLSSLVDRLGTGIRYGGEAAAEGTLESDLPGPLVARGGRTTVDGETMTTEHLLVYDGAADVPEGDARERLRADLAGLTTLLDAADLTVEVDGATLRATGTYETAAWVEAVREQTGGTTADGG